MKNLLFIAAFSYIVGAITMLLFITVYETNHNNSAWYSSSWDSVKVDNIKTINKTSVIGPGNISTDVNNNTVSEIKEGWGNHLGVTTYIISCNAAPRDNVYIQPHNYDDYVYVVYWCEGIVESEILRNFEFSKNSARSKFSDHLKKYHSIKF